MCIVKFKLLLKTLNTIKIIQNKLKIHFIVDFHTIYYNCVLKIL